MNNSLTEAYYCAGVYEFTGCCVGFYEFTGWCAGVYKSTEREKNGASIDRHASLVP